MLKHPIIEIDRIDITQSDYTAQQPITVCDYSSTWLFALYLAFCS